MAYLSDEGLIIVVSEVVRQYVIGKERCVFYGKTLAVLCPADSRCVLRIL